MIKILRVKCSRCGSKSRIPYIGFITQHGVKIYISKYPLDILKCKKCGNILGEAKE